MGLVRVLRLRRARGGADDGPRRARPSHQQPQHQPGHRHRRGDPASRSTPSPRSTPRSSRSATPCQRGAGARRSRARRPAVRAARPRAPARKAAQGRLRARHHRAADRRRQQPRYHARSHAVPYAVARRVRDLHDRLRHDPSGSVRCTPQQQGGDDRWRLRRAGALAAAASAAARRRRVRRRRRGPFTAGGRPAHRSGRSPSAPVAPSYTAQDASQLSKVFANLPKGRAVQKERHEVTGDLRRHRRAPGPRRDRGVDPLEPLPVELIAKKLRLSGDPCGSRHQFVDVPVRARKCCQVGPGTPSNSTPACRRPRPWPSCH